MTRTSDWCHLGQHDACTSPFCRCACGCEKRETRSTKGETVPGSSGESWDTCPTNQDGPRPAASTAGSPRGLADSTLRSVD